MNYRMNREDDINLSTIGILIIVGFLVLIFWIVGWPYYSIYSESMRGKAELARAEYNRQIVTLEANAKMESAKALAQAEVIRAHGVAESNQIIGDSLKENESYLRYLWIQGLQSNDSTVIYVPTEANLPVLEAGRFNRS